MTRASDHAFSESSAGRLQALFALHAHELKRLAFLMSGDMPLAEDIAQEAFLRVAGRLGHMRDPDRFAAYLRKTVINMVRDHFRRRPPQNAAARPPDRDLDSEHDLRIALAQLPHRQRAALVLRYYVDLPDDETADLLGCRRATVRSLVARGLEALKVQMEVELNE